MTLTEFHPSHLGALRPLWRSERRLLAGITRERVAALAGAPGVTLWVEGRPIACAGVLGDVELWAVFDQSCNRHTFTLLRAARQFLNRFGWLYARVDQEFRSGCRLLEVLGFQNTGPRKLAGRVRMQYERVA